MLSFGPKATLRRDFVTQYSWLQSCFEICEYLESRCDTRMKFPILDAKTIDEKQLNIESF